ncbi:MAG: hypothetical protein KDA80_12290, partial [Planctomycetaceae bacterium]|nr:hypothetical protein [Planctomycetaceae bacterium]
MLRRFSHDPFCHAFLLSSILFGLTGCADFAAEPLDTNLVFRLSPLDSKSDDQEEQGVDDGTLGAIESVVGERLRKSRLLSRFDIEFPDRETMEVSIPQVDENTRMRIVRLLTTSGRLEFALLATDVDHPELVALAQEQETDAGEITRDGQLSGKWLPTARDATGSEKITPGDRSQTRTRTINGD